MDRADETVAKWLTSKDAGETDEHPILCAGCGGWPIDDGAVFVAVLAIVGGERHHGWMCELCYLKKLQRRGHFVNISSGPTWQIDLPEIGIHPEHKPERSPPAKPLRRLRMECAPSPRKVRQTFSRA